MVIGERFWSKVNKHGPLPKDDACKEHPKIRGTRCYEWIGGCFDNGYGVFWLDGHNVKAHRFSYELHYGELGKKKCLHKCDNKKCVRPSHLFKGTMAENIYDRDVKGHHRIVEPYNRARGERVGTCKLADKEVLKIRRWRLDGCSYCFLGKFFGVSRSHVRAICLNTSRRSK